MVKAYAGLDVADKSTSICVLSATGEMLVETSAPTEVAAVADVLKPYRRVLAKVACESGSKSMWLAREMLRKKWPVVCLDARYTHAALSAAANKTDKNDARGIAQVLCRGIYTTSYVRSEFAQMGRAILVQRKAMLMKSIDLERLAAGVLKQVGGKLVRKGGTLVATAQKRRHLDHRLQDALEGSIRAIEVMRAETDRLDALIVRMTGEDPVCRRLMTVPGVGPITAFAFRTAIDDPTRFASSRTVAAYFGLTPRTFESGETSYVRRISKRGDSEVRSLLYQSAGSLINICKTSWRLKVWAKDLSRRKGYKLAAIACARRLAVVMHRMWVTERDFDPTS